MKLPKDKEAMLAVIDRYLALPDEERLLLRLGRRGGAMRQRYESVTNELSEETGARSRSL